MRFATTGCSIDTPQNKFCGDPDLLIDLQRMNRLQIVRRHSAGGEGVRHPYYSVAVEIYIIDSIQKMNA